VFWDCTAGLVPCAGKLHACKLNSCKVNAPINACSGYAAKPGHAQIRGKHYHCGACKEMSAKVKPCTHCSKACACGTCGTCGAGECCNYGQKKPCKRGACDNDVCRRCEQKAKVTGKVTGLCKDHHGKFSGLVSGNPPLVKRQSSNEKRKRRVCAECSGTERPPNRFALVGGNLYCAACVVSAPKQKAPPAKPTGVAEERAAKVRKTEPQDTASGAAQAAAAHAEPMDDEPSQSQTETETELQTQTEPQTQTQTELVVQKESSIGMPADVEAPAK